MGNFIDLTGRRFERWLVVKRGKTANRVTHWECKCDCGIVKDVIMSTLINGLSKSCGCYSSDRKRENFTIHGLNKTTTQRSYSSMKMRIFNTNNDNYERYGGRGITICDRWLGDSGFENFVKDMGLRPIGKTLDRKDTNGNYSPENCKWSSLGDQANNRRSNHNITYNGETLTLKQWANKIGIKSSTLSARIMDRKWSIEKSLTTPLINKKTKGA